jgi:N-acetyl-alpha-D-muramate 1-phosphate uridylyltransferase
MTTAGAGTRGMGKAKQKISDTAMVLAAGKGLRMRPLTLHRPKPMVLVAGRSLIDRALDRVVDAGFGKVIVNLHYRGAMLRKHLNKRDDLAFSFSDEAKALLETGGGVKKVLKKLSGTSSRPKPFLVLNSDALWLETHDKATETGLQKLLSAWDGRRMDALLLLQPGSTAIGHSGAGDYRRKKDGRLVRIPGGPAPYVFTGIQILHPRLFDGSPRGAFSLVRLYDKAEAAGRLFGVKHSGTWIDVGTPEGVDLAEKTLKDLGKS